MLNSQQLRSSMRLALLFALLTAWACVSAPTQAQIVIRQEGSAANDSSSATNTSASSPSNNEDPWTFTQTSLNQTSFTAQPYVANGYIGARLPAAGVGFQSYEPLADNVKAFGQGWPLFGPRVTASMVAGFYDVQPSTVGTNFPQNGGEQVISLLPSWPQLYLTLTLPDGTEATYAPGVDEATVKQFNQTLSIRDGVVTTEVQWQPEGVAEPITLQYTILAHRVYAPLAMMRLQVSGLANGTVTITDALDGKAAMRTENGSAGNATSPAPFEGASLPNNTIFASVQPLGEPEVTAYLYSSLQPQQQPRQDNVTIPQSVSSLLGLQNTSTTWQSYAFDVSSSNETLEVLKYVGIASSDAFGDQASQTALGAVTNATGSSWDDLLSQHKQEWETIWDEGGDIILQDQSTPLNVQLQRQARASLFHLLANTRRGSEGKGLGDNSIAPSGLTSDSYAGSIFWDAETFMFPSLSLLYPAFAEPILNYRHKVPGQPERNAQQYGKPGYLYPWVSARHQNCTGIGPCYDYEYHLGNDIALAHWQYFLQTQNRTFLEEMAFPIMQGVSQFWAAQVVETAPNATLQGPDNTTAVPPKGVNKYSTLNMTEPDEYANQINNGAFTNAGLTTVMLDTLYAAQLLNLTVEQINAQNWSSIANDITVLRENSSDIILEFEGFNSTVLVKQADVSLLIYPLEYNVAYPDREPAPRSDLDYYSGKTDPGGPGMTYSVYGVAATQLDGNRSTQIGPTCEGFTRLLQAGLPYEREFGQFSEQINDVWSQNGGDNPAGGVNPAYTFLTGHGGLLQMYTHGFLGYRARNNTDGTMHLDPNLPPQLYGGLTIRGVHHGDAVMDVDIQKDTTKITHKSGSQDVTIEVGDQRYTLSAGSTVDVPTRTAASAPEGEDENVALCRPIDDGSEGAAASSSESVALMQQTHAGTNLAQAAADGSNATYFQPKNDSSPSSLVLDLGESRTLNRMHFNFGNVPPSFVTVSISSDEQSGNDTTSPSQQVIVDRVAINITAPYDANDIYVQNATVRAPSAWNTTDFNLAEMESANSTVQARFVNITMEGVATPQDLGYGATLHEVQIY